MKRSESNFALNLATVFAIVVLFVLLLVTAAKADPGSDPGSDPGADDAKEKGSLYPVNSAADDFQRFCAACHGTDAQGRGPVGSILIRQPADLTRLSLRNDGDFPTDRVFWIIDGRGEVKAHGPREMPVWGYEFSRAAVGLELAPEAEVRIRALVEYLENLQREGD